MAANIRLKKSSVTGKQPLSGDLEYGELALNYADGILYYKNTSNDIANISGGGAVTDSAPPSGATVRDGGLWWDAVNGRLKVYYDDGEPTSTPITVNMTVDGTNTTNAYYEFSNAWTDRNGLKSTGLQNPNINIQTGDTVTMVNSVYTVHPIYFVTQLDPLTNNYNSSYNVELPASNYGGGASTTSYQFNTPGTYYYICGVHASMVGTITVVDSGTASKQWVDASPQGRGYTGSAGNIGYSQTPPVNPSGGQIWYDTKTGKSYIYYIVSGNGAWILFSDPTVSDGGIGYTGSTGFTGSRGTISPRGVSFLTPSVSQEQTIFYTESELTVSTVRGVKRGGTSVEYDLRYATSRNQTGTLIASDVVSDEATGDLATVTNTGIPANSYVWVELTGVTGIVDEFQLNIVFDE